MPVSIKVHTYITGEEYNVDVAIKHLKMTPSSLVAALLGF
jgi:hypothetical protein